MTIYHGHLVAYSEQGYEGRVDWLLDDDNIDHTTHNLADFLHPLQKGDHLTIFAPDQSIIWKSRIDPVFEECWLAPRFETKTFLFWKRQIIHKEGPWAPWIQNGIEAGIWWSWFSNNPPLKAKLDKADS